MEERVANIEGAIKLLTDILDRQDKTIASLAANQIILNTKTSTLEQTLESFMQETKNFTRETKDFMRETKGLFIQAGRQLRNHEERIEELEDK